MGPAGPVCLPSHCTTNERRFRGNASNASSGALRLTHDQRAEVALLIVGILIWPPMSLSYRETS